MKFSAGENDDQDLHLFSNDSPISTDMFTDSEDFLTQLSTDLGLSEFMDQDDSSFLVDSPGYEAHRSSTNLASSQLNFFPAGNEIDEASIFDEITIPDVLNPSPEWTFSGPDDFLSPSSNGGSASFPPSPSGSESSSSSTADSGIGNNVMGGCSRRSSGHSSPDIAAVTSPEILKPVHQLHVSPKSPPLTSSTVISIPCTIQCVTLPVSAAAMTTAPGSIVSVTDISNVKIAIPKITKPAPVVKTVQQSPILFTSQQLTQLSQGGIITSPTSAVMPNSLTPIVVKTEPGYPAVAAIPQGRYPSNYRSNPNEDMKSLKRQQRMIKNRESACLSRRKKKEYVTSLEEQLNQISHENSRLRMENEQLKTRVSELESEKQNFWSTPSVLSSANAKKATALCALLFVVALNVAPLSGIYGNTKGGEPLFRKQSVDYGPAFGQISKDDSHVGRSLLWASTLEEDSIKANNTNSSVSAKCAMMYFNSTESIRLDNELRGWFKLDPMSALANTSARLDTALPRLEPTVENVKHRRPKRHLADRKASNSRNTLSAVEHYAGKPEALPAHGNVYHMVIPDHISRGSKDSGLHPSAELTLYESQRPLLSLESFFEAIRRREDTFYVVSFSGDHLLLPAMSRNESVRPRMSLFLPSLAVPVNDSMKPPANHISMMQIDCEVINTSLVHISQDAIPIHLNGGPRRRPPTASRPMSTGAARNSSGGNSSGGSEKRTLHREASEHLRKSNNENLELKKGQYNFDNFSFKNVSLGEKSSGDQFPASNDSQTSDKKKDRMP